MDNRRLPKDAAKLFVDDRFPGSDAALLAGSVIRGEATETSDLDIVVFDQKIADPYRESLLIYGWPIEVFVYNFDNYRGFFERDVKRARPSLPRMLAEGLPIKDHGRLRKIQKEAAAILSNGPGEWSEKEIRIKQYFISDILDDFIGSSYRTEELFIASSLINLLHEFVLRSNNSWIGSSKWMYREMEKFDKELADSFAKAFDCFYKNGDKSQVIAITDLILQPFGGRLFDGFSLK